MGKVKEQEIHGGLVAAPTLPVAAMDVPQSGREPAGDAVPRHVAIIMDGNRRWARDRGLPDAQGHAAGVEAIRPIVEHAQERGVEVLSIFAFSRENWARARGEVETLFALLESAIRDYTPDLVRQGVRVRLLGRIDELSAGTQASIEDALSATAERHAHDPQRGLQLLRPLGDRRRGAPLHRGRCGGR